MVEEFFLGCAAVEPGNRAQSLGDGGAGAAAGFQVTGEALGVRAARSEQPQLVLLTPGRVLAQVQLVGLASQAGWQPLGLWGASRSGAVVDEASPVGDGCCLGAAGGVELGQDVR